MRRIGVLMTVAADDPEAQPALAALLQGLQQLDWAMAATCGSSPLGWRQYGRHAQTRCRARAPSRRTLSLRMAAAVRTIAAARPHGADRVRDRARSGRRWFR